MPVARVLDLTGDDRSSRARGANPQRQDRRARGRKCREADLGKAKRRGLGGENVVAGQRQFKAAAKTASINQRRGRRDTPGGEISVVD